MNEIPIIVAFAAGLASFLAPCVIPIIPAFLSYLGGVSINDARAKRKVIFLNSFFFVLGFSLVFAAIGVLLNTVLGSVAYSAHIWLSRIGGIIIIFFGIHLTRILRIPFLEAEHKFRVGIQTRSRYFTSFLFGLAFAAGWTPCAGPTLGIIFGVAVSTPELAFILLLSYALGLGIPFLITGLFVSQADTFIRNHRTIFRHINLTLGIVLIVLGVLAFTQKLVLISSWKPLLGF